MLQECRLLEVWVGGMGVLGENERRISYGWVAEKVPIIYVRKL